MLKAIVAIIMAIVGWFGGRKQSVDEQLGAEEAANAALRSGIDSIRKADEAAKQVAKEAPRHDPNDLDSTG